MKKFIQRSVVCDSRLPPISLHHRPIQFPMRIHQPLRPLVIQVRQRPPSQFTHPSRRIRHRPLRIPSHRLIHPLHPRIADNAIAASLVCTASNNCDACVDCIAITAGIPIAGASAPPTPPAQHPPSSPASSRRPRPGPSNTEPPHPAFLVSLPNHTPGNPPTPDAPNLLLRLSLLCPLTSPLPHPAPSPTP